MSQSETPAEPVNEGSGHYTNFQLTDPANRKGTKRLAPGFLVIDNDYFFVDGPEDPKDATPESEN